MIPLFDAKRQAESLDGALEKAAADVIQDGSYILGKYLAKFESQFAGYLGVKHAIGVGNGTDAIKLALKAAQIKPGDKVAVPALTAIPTAMAIVEAGATPFFVDIDEKTLLLDPDDLAERLDESVRMILPVHLYGQAMDQSPIQHLAHKNNIMFIEDCAQAHGAAVENRKVGTFGVAGAYSFYPSKNLGALGDGGMIVTNDDAVAYDVRLLHNYGLANRYRAEIPGANSRLDDLQAALLSVKLKHLDLWNERRREIAGKYIEMLKDLDLGLPEMTDGHVFHLFVVRTKRRDELRAHLAKLQIAAETHYPIPLHLQKAFAELGYKQGDFPKAEAAAAQVLSIPLFPEMTDAEVEKVGNAIRTFLK